MPYLNTQTVTLETTNVPTMEKAKFLGWSKTKTSIYKDAAPGEGVLITSITFGENDETVYAVWASDIDGDGEPDYEETKYDLNYDVNGGQNGTGKCAGCIHQRADGNAEYRYVPRQGMARCSSAGAKA